MKRFEDFTGKPVAWLMATGGWGTGNDYVTGAAWILNTALRQFLDKRWINWSIGLIPRDGSLEACAAGAYKAQHKAIAEILKHAPRNNRGMDRSRRHHHRQAPARETSAGITPLAYSGWPECE